ncbi:MAG: class I SAM-dependent methyltransferase [Deltaproteobacteria bacterium]|jgi:SAM-dependent methyltransferase|nr:class I SAM-dependent methyltransferase [Deltaproteobacteria bacterium]
MTALYDKFAKQYKASKRLPFREYIEWYSYNKLLGDVSQKSVLDLACGEGFYTRRIKRKGADSVVGVDISGEMIRLAKQQEQHNPLGVDYIPGDVMALGSIGQFDLVVASYLLNYAETNEQLLKMFQTIAANLQPAGRFVSINNNPDQPPESFPICEKYGFTKSVSGPLKEGAAITYEFFRSGKKFRFDNFYLSRNTHEWAARQAGFNSIQWHKIQVSPQGLKIFGQDFWQDFIDYEPIVGIVCLNGLFK